MPVRIQSILTAVLFALAVTGCGNLAPVLSSIPANPAPSAIDSRGYDVVLFALGLVETDYRFGGKNPEAGLDCSGMVSYVFDKAANIKLAGSAADIARKGQSIDLMHIKPGDLVFFNVANRSHSHVGIYIGDQRFVHAPSKNGKVRTDSLKAGWFATRFEEARTYFN